MSEEQDLNLIIILKFSKKSLSNQPPIYVVFKGNILFLKKIAFELRLFLWSDSIFN